MTYQLHITHYRSDSNDARLLMYSTIFLSLLFLNTLGVAFNITMPQLSLVNLVLGIVFLIALATQINKRFKVPFVNIHDNTLEYFSPEEGEIISIPSLEITKITTRFNELNIHTSERVHSLNLGLIRQEQTRWEIKEMIRRMARPDGHNAY
ncbi:hypothetical protein GZH53_05870 [Flavihumibacter sp. R14]|nr:hypothetical protein [Flavihumibacter soli]